MQVKGVWGEGGLDSYPILSKMSSTCCPTLPLALGDLSCIEDPLVNKKPDPCHARDTPKYTISISSWAAASSGLGMAPSIPSNMVGISFSLSTGSWDRSQLTQAPAHTRPSWDPCLILFMLGTQHIVGRPCSTSYLSHPCSLLLLPHPARGACIRGSDGCSTRLARPNIK